MFREIRNRLTCWHWDGILTLIGLLKVLVVGDREGNWESHLQVIEKLLSIFLISVSINYLRYWSWYLEKMRKLPHEHPEVYKHFQEGKFVVKTNAGYVKTVAADMKLEQSIQRVCHWMGISIPRSLAMSKNYGKILKSVLANTDANPLHK